MNRTSYMSKNELINFLKIGCLTGEISAILPFVKDKAWHKKLKTCTTFIEGILLERLTCMDREQILAVDRRKNTTHVILRTTDQDRTVAGTPEEEKVTVAIDDLEELAELALNSCTVCREGDSVAGCRFRKVMHRLGIPVANDDPAPGRCEFKAGGEAEAALNQARGISA